MISLWNVWAIIDWCQSHFPLWIFHNLIFHVQLLAYHGFLTWIQFSYSSWQSIFSIRPLLYQHIILCCFSIDIGCILVQNQCISMPCDASYRDMRRPLPVYCVEHRPFVLISWESTKRNLPPFSFDSTS